MRLFVAAELPQEMRDALAETSAALRGRVHGRYVAPDSFHATLAFIGEVEGYRADDAAEALERACTGRAPIEASLGELGCFGRRSKATLWQGVNDNGALAELAATVRRELRASDFHLDEKTFLAHVTLMRAADVTGGELPMPAFAAGKISRVSLFKSDLSGERPAYEPLYTIELAESDWGDDDVEAKPPST